ncbi:MAG: RusA family crossover junction endodeoxyribonuclease [Myxococcales bacterium]|nr:MAG: RusA family crossover junction endodeoxyribonuclease [Myxococcales bacterium]
MNKMFLQLPIPPTANNLFATGRRNGKFCRFRTKKYLAWQKEAGLMLQTSKKIRFAGEVEIEITLPSNIRGDIDNRVKPIFDLLVKYGIVCDDRYIRDFHVTRRGTNAYALISVVNADPPKKLPSYRDVRGILKGKP